MAWIWFLVAVFLFFALGSVEQSNQKNKKELEELKKSHAALKTQQELTESTRKVNPNPISLPLPEDTTRQTLHTVIGELQSFLASQIQDKRQRLQGEIEDLKSKRSGASEEQSSALAQQIAALRSQLDLLVAPTLNEVKAGIGQGVVGSTLQHLAESLESSQTELGAEKSRHLEAQAKANELLAQLKVAQSEVQTLQSELRASSPAWEVKDLEKRLTELQQAVQAKAEELEQVTQKLVHTYSLEGPLGEVSEVERQLRDKTEELETLSSRLVEVHSMEEPLVDLEKLNKEIFHRQEKIASLKAEMASWTPVTEAGAALDGLTKKIGHKKNEVLSLEREITSLKKEIESLKYELVPQEFGLYEPKYEFAESGHFKEELKRVRDNQKYLIRAGYAVIKPVDWHVNGSTAAGNKMVERFAKLQLRAFNGECEGYILKVRFDNIRSAEEKIRVLYDRINKMSGDIACYISDEYLQLKIDELNLAHEYQERKQAEKIEQMEIREQIREEKKALAELKREEEKAAMEEAFYEDALARARQEFELTEGKLRAEISLQLEELQLKLDEARARSERALSMAQQTRAGHVYVISNVGSFGENVYKIGMTRRLDPLERVRELGGASVPFHFDVHAIISSSDAPKLEAELHRAFEAYRINKVNPRKEFFKVSLKEIERVVRENHGDIEFTLAADAHDYRQSKALVLQA